MKDERGEELRSTEVSSCMNHEDSGYDVRVREALFTIVGIHVIMGKVVVIWDRREA